MDRAIEVDMAEFVRADIEVYPIDAVWLIETPVSRGLNLRPRGYRIGYRLQLAGKCWLRRNSALRLARQGGKCLVGHNQRLQPHAVGFKPSYACAKRRVATVSIRRDPTFNKNVYPKCYKSP